MTDYISNYTGEEIDAGIAKANTALQSYEYLNSVIEQAFDEITDEDSEITLNNTIQAKMKMDLKGNTEQTTYTGKNLLPNSESLSNTGQYQDVIKFTDLEPSTEYTLKAKGTAGDKFYTGGSMPYSSLTIPSNGVLEFTFTTSSTISDLAIIKNTTATNTLPLTECTLCKGSTATYEPYVGGSPSPSPDYPQDVRVVTSNNSVKVVGKNLCNGINQNVYLTTNTRVCAIADNNNGLYIPVSGGNYTISTKTTQERYRVACTSNEPSATAQTAYNGVNRDGTNNNITIDTTGYSYLIVNVTDLTKIQIEKSSTATTYEPYQSQTYPINLGTMELCKIRGYQDYIFQDYIYKNNGKWYKHSEIGKVVLDGSEYWRFQSINDYGIANYSTDAVQSTLTANSFYAYCSHFEKQTSPISTTTTQGIFNASIEYFYIRILPEIINVSSDDSSDVKIQKIKTWLSTHNVEVYYVLETPTDTEITDTTLINQLNALENAMSYKTQTNISQTNANLPFILYASALGKLSS